MSDNGMKSRVRGLLSGPTTALERVERVERVEPVVEPPAQDDALHVLTLAQKTADDHVTEARRKADRIRADARATAEQMLREAQAHGEKLHQDAEAALSDARAAAAQLQREAKSQLDKARRSAEEILSATKVQADEITKKAQAGAEELRQQAQQRYDDVVGGLAAKRAALQRQIEALDQFDREYRARLTGFLQNQLRTLWVDEPHVNAEDLERAAPAPANTRPPVAREPS
ncbi:MAG TPA: hypothetical protein VJT31_20660 [Rugosimonospora sp.]|nr:hypothetical protein [Rugosimonospora sp.]